MIWRFTAYIKGLTGFTEAQVNALFDAGCSDGSPASGQGHAWIGFDRDAETLQGAISSAVSEIRSVGLEVERVEIEESDLSSAELAQWQMV